MQKAYLVKHKDLSIRLKSRSGGIFTAVTDPVIENGGIIYGCVINGSFTAEHRRASSKQGRDSFRGSKYVQSSMMDCYKEVKTDLEKGRAVLFSGTGCQVNGLNGFLNGVDCEKLFTVDIVCHGVPSPLVWTEFLSYIEQKNSGKIESVNFRDKRYGWMSHFETVVINGKKRTADYYREMFYKHYTLRPCCYKCPFANTERSADITIADAWGVDNKYSAWNDDKGCSLVLVNTNKGKSLFEEATKDIDYVAVDLEDYMQPNLRHPSSRPDNRDSFWTDFYDRGFEYVSMVYGANTLKGQLRSMVKRVLGRTGLTKKAKKILKI